MKFLPLFLLLSISAFSQHDSSNVTVYSVIDKLAVAGHTISDSVIQSNYHGQEIPMLLSNQPSIFTNSDGGAYSGYSYFSIRGIDQTRINISLNDIPLNEEEDNGCYTSNFPSFISSVSAIQIQRGVGLSTNGLSSFGGSLNFKNKDGLMRGTDIQIGVGSFNTSRFDISTSTGLLDNKFSLFVNIGGINSDGFRDNSGSKGGSVFISLGYFGKYSTTKLNILNGLSQNKQAWMGSTDSILNVNYKNNPRGGDNMDYFNQTNIQLQNVTILNKFFKLNSTLFYNYLTGRYDVFNTKDISINNYFAHEGQYSNWYGGLFQLEYNKGGLKILTSLFASNYKRFHNGYEIYDSQLSKFPYTNNGDKNDINGFIRINYNFKKIFYFIDVQERFVDYKYSGDTSIYLKWEFFNPKAGVKFLINKNIDLFYSIGVSHREPTHSIMLNGNLYLNQSNVATIVNPEKVIDNEFGVNFNFSNFRINSDIYLMKFTNEMINAGPIGNNSLPILINVPKSIRYGFEIDGEYKISKKFIYQANSTISNGDFKVDSGTYNYLLNPNFLFKHNLVYTYKKLFASVNHVYMSKVFIDKGNKFTLPVSSTIGVNIGYKFQKVELKIQMNNITNEKTYSNGNVLNGVKYSIPNALRNCFLTLKITI